MTTTAGSLALAGLDRRRRTRSSPSACARPAPSSWARPTSASGRTFARPTRPAAGAGAADRRRNPYALDRNPCGSSSGSGARDRRPTSRASAIGTETDGSIVCPSSATCGIVGIKPTLGLVSRAGIIPIAHSQDTAGPMARTVRDAAILLGAHGRASIRATRRRRRAAASASPTTRSSSMPTACAARASASRASSSASTPRVDRLMDDAHRRDEAPRRRDRRSRRHPASCGEYDDSELEVLLYEFKADLERVSARLGAGRRRADARGRHRASTRRTASARCRTSARSSSSRRRRRGRSTTHGYLEALAKNQRLARAEGIDAVMDEHKLDALVAPTGGPAWTTDLVNGDHFTGGSSTARGGRRLSEHHRAGGIRLRAAGGHLVLRPRLERADAAQARLRVRAGDAATAARRGSCRIRIWRSPADSPNRAIT